MIPPNHQLILLDSTIPLIVIHHILHRLIPRIHPRLRPLNRQRKRIHDVECSVLDLAVHETHDLVLASGTGVNDHFDERDGGDFHGLEVVRAVQHVS
jgi:hypothetical protein